MKRNNQTPEKLIMIVMTVSKTNSIAQIKNKAQKDVTQINNNDWN